MQKLRLKKTNKKDYFVRSNEVLMVMWKACKGVIGILGCSFVLGCSPKPPQIAIQPMGGFPIHLSDTVAHTLLRIYGFPVIILPDVAIPKHTFIQVKSPRYRADKLIRFLKEEQSDSVDYTLGLLTKDISTTKYDKWGEVLKPAEKYEDWGVFGLGFRPGPSCVVSTYRFKKRATSKFMMRLKKISVHEIGHNLGLAHCPNKNCVMTDAAESIKTIDHVVLGLCEDCENALHK